MPDHDEWIGRVSTAEDIAAAAPLRRLAALLDGDPQAGIETVPPLAHWLYFLPDARQSEIGADGHPSLGRSLPDFGLPRRMWAGSRVSFHAPIPIGAPLVRRTEIISITEKVGASGPLAFVTLRHQILTGNMVAIVDEQDLVYREAAVPGSPPPPPAFDREPVPEGAITCAKRFDAVQLFRFSALTFNGHRIHYDRDYARDVEAYPALVVHGPFQAISLIDHFSKNVPHAGVTSFAFRAHRPLFEGEEALLGVEADENKAISWIRPGGASPSITAAIGFKP